MTFPTPENLNDVEAAHYRVHQQIPPTISDVDTRESVTEDIRLMVLKADGLVEDPETSEQLLNEARYLTGMLITLK